MPLDPQGNLDEVLNAAFAALGPRNARGQALPNPNLARQVAEFPERGGNLLLGALGPLGEAGSTLGEILRTRGAGFDARDLPQIAGGVMLGTMVPGGAEVQGIERGALGAAENLLIGPSRRAGYDEALKALLGDVPEKWYGSLPAPNKMQPEAVNYTNPVHWKQAGGTAPQTLMQLHGAYFDPDKHSIDWAEMTPQAAAHEIVDFPQSKAAHVLFNEMPWPAAKDVLGHMANETNTSPGTLYSQLYPIWKQSGEKPLLSDEEINTALKKNPGASIFDIAGTEPNAAHNGYELHESGYPGDYFVHAPNGEKVGEITKQDSGKYKLEMYNGDTAQALSPLDTLKIAAQSHANMPGASEAASGKIAPVTNDYSADLEPLDWTNFMPRGMDASSFADLAMREHARSLGFNVNLPLYKGGSLHEYPNELYIPNKQTERGFFLSDQPNIAQAYVHGSGTTMPYLARANNPLTIDWNAATGLREYEEGPMHDIIEAARAKGADLLHIRGLTDIGGKQDQYVVLDPSILRAPSAQFDPAKLHLAKPLAGLAGLGLGTGLFFDQNGNPLINRGEMK